MSNLYVTEPGTNGKVIIDTTAGEIEMELWGKEAPKAVRNFLQLAMEGYYDGVIFHRIVKGFVIQTGDPTGTGKGGESIYGDTFEDEIHGRLKFNRRGLVGMANSGKRHTNTSQFFITLDRADELTNKHTVFGKVMGNTIYSAYSTAHSNISPLQLRAMSLLEPMADRLTLLDVLSIAEVDVDAEERPIKPPKVRGIRIIENPFEDIVPRITAAEKKAQMQARLEAKKDAELREKRAKAKKNTGLLSFGEAEEIPSEQVIVKKKGITRQDLVEEESSVPQKRAAESFVPVPDSLQDFAGGKDEDGTRKDKKAKVELKDIRAQHERERLGQTAAREAEIKRMTEDLRKLKKRTGQNSDSESDSDDGKRRKGPSILQQEIAKYAKNRGRAARQVNRKGKKDEEDDILKAMSRFSKQVKREAEEEEEEKREEEERRKAAIERERAEAQAEAEADEAGDGGTGEIGADGRWARDDDVGRWPRDEPRSPKRSRVARDAGDAAIDEGLIRGEEGLEVDDDVGWMKHSLKFEVDEKELTRRAEDEYSVIDPRAKAKALAGQDRSERDGKRSARTAADVGRRR